ncbi:MAG: potassium/proton antiporter [Candidatus Omnitrophica bacterium]|nr:potassium/proton antiporter [Candidatus Omnitrophota bacterium]
MNIIQYPIEVLILIISVLLLLSVISSKASDRLGIPSLLIFLIVGILAGSEGIGGIHFDDPWLAKFLGIMALVLILFSGGLETKMQDIRPILKQGILLSILGVLMTALLVAVFVCWLFHFSFLEGFLLGAIISSTDAAAVLTILRSRNVNLKPKVRSLLELESGSNDPMAVFLTLGIIQLITLEKHSFLELIPAFFLEIGIGAAMGYVMSRVILLIITRSQLSYEGLYPVLTISLSFLTYALTTVLHGNGFLAVYLAAILLGNSQFRHKKVLIRFHEGFAWLNQIVIFLALGLLVSPSKILPIIGMGLIISFFLMVIARPLSVFICLAFSSMQLNEKLVVSWVGLRGAVPIILAIFPWIVGIPHAETIFHIVFFIVLTSILLQGTSIPIVSKWLKVAEPSQNKRIYPIEFEPVDGIDANLEEILVPYESVVVGQRLFEIDMPAGCLIVLVCRDEQFAIPNGATVVEGGDVLLVLADKAGIAKIQSLLAKQKKSDEEAA